MDPEYLPAKIQLCQDLLRLGDETRAGSSPPRSSARMATTWSPTT